ncbi:MAG TPA: VWA domain-containing protein, partial [Candidatus Omnitrophota bacterium]|nr:VWA domain-containing protein [Candidatus Omnitrophota bacterium]
DILIAVDTSKSMLAADIAPTRLAAVKTDIKDFLKTARGDRVGLIAFSGSAFMICPLTVDIDGLSLMIDTINENSIPRGGTSFQSLLDETIRASDYNKIKDKTLIIYSDGETTTGRLSNLPRKTKSSDMSIYCIGVGTEKGSTITYKDTTGETRLIRDTNNETVVSRLEEQTLKEIAATSGGTYTRFRTDRNNLQALYVNDLKNIKRTSTDSMEKKRNNRFQIPLGIAILMLFWTEATRGKR